MSSNESAPTHQQGLKPWQRRAVDRGRTPLPENPGARPWETKPTTQDQTSSGNTPGSAPSSGDGTNQSASQPATTVAAYPYRFWPTEEIERLIRLRRDGLSWNQIKDHFPDRSLESLKQTYHKRRAAVEAEMGASE
ncbi:hypothetical protein HYE67_010033 [Fusarium culmorum]|uniref:Myb-like domain-containing protein n=1 Tax=Fusarium culmorum TaxID=5516 RepID=A0A7S8DFX0_FUSCU|nr:hypothetical protein HYE67_010033 [Fusarium culmorum]